MTESTSQVIFCLNTGQEGIFFSCFVCCYSNVLFFGGGSGRICKSPYGSCLPSEKQQRKYPQPYKGPLATHCRGQTEGSHLMNALRVSFGGHPFPFSLVPAHFSRTSNQSSRRKRLSHTVLTLLRRRGGFHFTFEFIFLSLLLRPVLLSTPPPTPCWGK